MAYFSNISFVPYKFGTSENYTLHQNLSKYVDLIDQVRDNNSFYQKYTILDGDRPDILSYKLYGSTKYYWTFFLMNDHIRENGWPFSTDRVIALVQKERNNTVLTTRDDLTGIFKVGSTVTGATSGSSGVVIKRRLDFGQIILEGSHDFLSTEDVQCIEGMDTNSVTLVGATDEYNSIFEYQDSEGLPVDIDPYIGPGAELSPITFTDRYIAQNNIQKEIIVIKPDAIGSIFEQFQNAMLD